MLKQSYKTTTKEIQLKIEEYKMSSEIKSKSLAEVAYDITSAVIESRQKFQDYPDWPIRKILNMIGYEAGKGHFNAVVPLVSEEFQKKLESYGFKITKNENELWLTISWDDKWV